MQPPPGRYLGHMETNRAPEQKHSRMALALFALLAAPACQASAQPEPPTEGAAPMSEQRPTEPERNLIAARRWSEELWGQGHLEVADEIVAPDYVRHDAGDPFAARGPADVKRIVSMLRSMLPDLRIEIEDMVAAGDRVVTRYVGVATDTRGYLGLPATGQTTRTPAIQIFRFREGKIAESWAVRDDLGTLVQLGHLPRPGSAELNACLSACARR
jgi:steroid delta-isomerase-like uncharacterized protein